MRLSLVGVGGVFVFPQFEADIAIARFKLGDPVFHELVESGWLDFLDVAERVETSGQQSRRDGVGCFFQRDPVQHLNSKVLLVVIRQVGFRRFFDAAQTVEHHGVGGGAKDDDEADGNQLHPFFPQGFDDIFQQHDPHFPLSPRDVLGIFFDFVEGDFRYLTGVHLDDFIRHFGNPQVMGDDDDGFVVVFVQILQQLQNFFRIFFIQRAGGFVAEDDVGILGQAPDDRNPLLLPAGELAGIFVAGFFQTDLFEQLGYVERCGADVRANLDILVDVQVLQQVVLLEDEAQMFPSEGGHLLFV